jgi:hypothetical protein
MALTQDKNIPAKHFDRKVKVPVAASTTIYRGSMVCMDADGYGIPATDTAGLSDVVGRSNEFADNSAGADGDIEIEVDKGVFGYAAGTGITQADVGRAVVVEDDETVQDVASGTNDIPAGTLEELEGSIAWVAIL